MSMVQVRIVRMRVHQRVMPVRMGMRLVALRVILVSMLVVLVMNMRVRVLHPLVRMLVPLGKVQAYPKRHPRRRSPEEDCRLLA